MPHLKHSRPSKDAGRYAPTSRRTFLELSLGAIGTVGAGSLLSACGGSDSAGSKAKQSPSKTITVMTPFALDANGILAYRTLGTDKLGFTLKWQAQTQDTVISQILAATQNGKPPDVILWDSGYVPTVLGAGVPLLPLDDYIAREEKSVFYPQDREVSLVGGKQYAAGISVQPRGIAYRTDISASENAPVPTSWSFDEFVAWAGKMTARGAAGFGFEAQQGDVRFPSNFLPLLWSTGAKLVIRDGGNWKVGFRADQMEKVLAFYNNLVKANATPRDIITWGYNKTDPGLVKNVISSYSTGPFEQYELVQYPKVRKHIGVAPLPNGGTPANYWEEAVLMIHSGSKNQENAWKFIEQIRSADVQKTLVDKQKSILSPRRDVNAAITDPWLRQFVKLLPQSQVPEQIDSFTIFSKAISPALGDMLVHGLSPADATKQLMAKMQAVLPQLS